MTPGTRTRYFSMWGKACAVKGWNVKDQEKRRNQVLFCMTEVRGPLVTTSDEAFGPDEITALFVYLDHLAHPSDLLKSAAWVDCKTDYRAYNKARQADWLEEQAYGKQGSGKLRRNRFGGQKKAAGEALDPLDPVAIKKRLVTMATRAASKGYVRRRPAPAAAQHFNPPPPAPVASEEELRKHNCAW